MGQKSLSLYPIFSEDVISYALYKNYISKESRVFFKVSNNMDIITGRKWNYFCAPDVDAIEVTKDNTLIAYELKGVRRGKKKKIKFEVRPPDFPAFYEGIGQALAYFNLPYVNYVNDDPAFNINCVDKFKGGVFDFVYCVYARVNSEFPEHERRVFNLLPLGVILALPNGEFEKVKEASINPIQNKGAKEHFLANLNTLEKFSTNGKTFRTVKEKGERFFQSVINEKES